MRLVISLLLERTSRSAAVSLRRQGALNSPPFLGACFPWETFAKPLPPLTGECRDGGENALKASNRERRLRQAKYLIENPTVRQQALARLAASEEQTARCTLCGALVSTPGLCALRQAHEGQESET